DFGGLDVDDRRLPVSFRVALAECGEIMTAHNQFGGARHLADLQPVLHPPDIFFAEGRAPRRDLIKVAPRNGVVAGTETIRGLLDYEDVDVLLVVFVRSNRFGLLSLPATCKKSQAIWRPLESIAAG